MAVPTWQSGVGSPCLFKGWERFARGEREKENKVLNKLLARRAPLLCLPCWSRLNATVSLACFWFYWFLEEARSKAKSVKFCLAEELAAVVILGWFSANGSSK